MTKKLLSVLLLVVVLVSSVTAFAALPVEDTENPCIEIKSASYDEDKKELTLVASNISETKCSPVMFVLDTNSDIVFEGLQSYGEYGSAITIEGIDAGAEKTIIIPVSPSKGATAFSSSGAVTVSTLPVI